MTDVQIQSGDARAVERQHIDGAGAMPVLYLLLSGVAWLLLAGMLSTVTALKLVFPTLLASCSYITFGKLSIAASTALKLGFVSQAGLGAVLWILARSVRKPLVGGGLITLANVFWNLALTLGVGGILWGDSTGMDGLELPRYAAPLMFVSLVCIATWAVRTYQLRKEQTAILSVGWILGALFWFCWSYATALVLGVFFPGHGILPVITAAWFQGAFTFLWAGSVSLAVLFYFAPTIRQRPVAYPGLALLGFWGWALFAGWTGPARLVGGPVPAWMISSGIVGSVLLVLPAVFLTISLWATLCWKGIDRSRSSVAAGFFVMAAVVFPVEMIGQAIHSIRGISEITHFTLRDVAFDTAYFHGFVALALFGALYEIIPRILGRSWPMPVLVRAHLGVAVLGLFFAAVPAFLAGWKQGQLQNIGMVAPADAMAAIRPFLFLRILGLLSLGLGHLIFIGNFLLMVRQVVVPQVPKLLSFLGIPLNARLSAALKLVS